MNQILSQTKEALLTAHAVIQGGSSLDREKSSFWTRCIKAALCKKGKELGYYTCASIGESGAADHGEWLYDVSWLQYSDKSEITNSERRQFHHVVLAVESEWKPKMPDLLDDFEKLIQSRSALRVMIFELRTTSPEDFNKVVDRLSSAALNASASTIGDHYLFVGFPNDSRVLPKFGELCIP